MKTVKEYLEGLKNLYTQISAGNIKLANINEKGLTKGRVRVGSFLLEQNHYDEGDTSNVYAGVYIMSNGNIKYRKEGKGTIIGHEGPFEVLEPIEKQEGIFRKLKNKDISQDNLNLLIKDFKKLTSWINHSRMFSKN